jgi:transcriptional regulator with XRE-family HTH domain
MKKRSVVGENMRRLRLKAGFTQEEIALRSGLTQGYINHLEMGKRNYTQKSLELIADALSTPVIDFFKEDQEHKPAVSEAEPVYRDKKAIAKELLIIIKDLPEAVAGHYLTLMKIERDLLRSQRLSG